MSPVFIDRSIVWQNTSNSPAKYPLYGMHNNVSTCDLLYLC